MTVVRKTNLLKALAFCEGIDFKPIETNLNEILHDYMAFACRELLVLPHVSIDCQFEPVEYTPSYLQFIQNELTHIRLNPLTIFEVILGFTDLDRNSLRKHSHSLLTGFVVLHSHYPILRNECGIVGNMDYYYGLEKVFERIYSRSPKKVLKITGCGKIERLVRLAVRIEEYSLYIKNIRLISTTYGNYANEIFRD